MVLNVEWEKRDVMRAKLQKYENYVHSLCITKYILCVMLCTFFV
jgi:hypothetical protein